MAIIQADSFEIEVGKFFSKLPILPSSFLEKAIFFAPFIAITAGIGTILTSGILSLFRLSSLPIFLNNKVFGVNYYLYIASSIVIGVSFLLAFSPLSVRSLKGWRMVLYTTLLSFIQSMFFLSLGNSVDILGNIVVMLVGLYVLFQIRGYYR
ncbi:MAG: hypothetical protein Q7S61_00475 [bacterium]|nr:hypothetical protein [bacterium]